jgi:hypothetical protein
MVGSRVPSLDPHSLNQPPEGASSPMNPPSAPRLLRKWFIWIPILIVIALFVFDFDGWRAFLLNITGSFLLHAVITLLLFGSVVLVTGLAQKFTGVQILSRGVLRVIFLVAALAGLALLRTVLRRAIDNFDLTQVAVLFIASEGLLDPLNRIIRKLFRSPVSGRKYAAPSPLVPHSAVERQLYDELLSRVLGNRDTADSLIKYERSRTPRASLDDLIASALERWIRDNQR